MGKEERSTDILEEFVKEPASVPKESSLSYDRAQYEIEKILRLRRKEKSPIGGCFVLKRLSPLHGHIISLHCAGLSTREIADTLGIKPRSVMRTIDDPLARPIIETYYADMDAEFRALYKDVIGAVRKGLNHEDANIALSAAEKWMKAHGKFKPAEQGANKLTAEDVVQQLLAAHRNSGKNVELSVKVSSPKDQSRDDPLMIDSKDYLPSEDDTL